MKPLRELINYNVTLRKLAVQLTAETILNVNSKYT